MSQVATVAVVGSANVDLILTVDRLAGPGETVLAWETARAPGGKGANQAVTAAHLGCPTGLVARLGDDDDGRWLRGRLVAGGVDVAHVGVSAGPTGRAVVQVDRRGENSIVVAPGANAMLTTEHVEAAESLVADAGVVLAQLEVPVTAIAAALRLARGQAFLNPAPAAALAPDLLRHVDVLIPNRAELGALAGVPEPRARRDVLAAVERLGVAGSVVVTLGADGAIVCAGGLTEHVPAPVVETVDTTGAGDAFCGALADATVRGATLVEATRWAVDVAAKTTTWRGAQPASARSAV